MNEHSTIIRNEQPGDEAVIREVLLAAFPTDVEARLVEALRAAGRLTVSLVAVAEGEIVGHVAFSPVHVGDCGKEIAAPRGQGLAPVAVRPQWQRRGIGAALVRAGIEACRAGGCAWLVVLGEPEYYGRFGFRPAADWGLVDEYGGGAAFQALELAQGAIPAGGGTVRYAREFGMFGE